MGIFWSIVPLYTQQIYPKLVQVWYPRKWKGKWAPGETDPYPINGGKELCGYDVQMYNGQNKNLDYIVILYMIWFSVKWKGLSPRPNWRKIQSTLSWMTKIWEVHSNIESHSIHVN